MSLIRKSIAGTFRLGGGQVLTFTCSFVRLAILARLLSKVDFGIAATFAITIAILDMIGNVSLNRLIVQSSEGESRDFQASLHLVEVARGFFNAALLFVLAWPLSHFFGVPDARWAFQCLALYPVMRGFIHLDTSRFEREMNFRPRVVMEVLPQVVITLLAWPVAAWLQDYTAFLWLFIVRMVLVLAISHYLAEWPYRCRWQKGHGKEILQFGWPLMLNAVLLYLVSQGDRLVIGNQFGMELLAIYTAAATLSMVPGQIVRRINSALVLPLLSQFKSEAASFRKTYASCREVLTLISGWCTGVLVLLSALLPVLAYGEKYVDAAVLVTPLAIAAGILMLRGVHTTAAMSLGDTKIVLYANVIRCAGLAITLGVVLAGYPLVWAAWTMALSEALTVVLASGILWLRHPTMVPGIVARTEVVWAIGMGLTWTYQARYPVESILGGVVAAVIYSILWVAAACLLLPRLRKFTRRFIQNDAIRREILRPSTVGKQAGAE